MYREIGGDSLADTNDLGKIAAIIRPNCERAYPDVRNEVRRIQVQNHLTNTPSPVCRQSPRLFGERNLWCHEAQLWDRSAAASTSTGSSTGRLSAPFLGLLLDRPLGSEIAKCPVLLDFNQSLGCSRFNPRRRTYQ